MKYPTFLSLIAISMMGCGDDSSAEKGVFVPSNDAGTASDSNTSDSGTPDIGTSVEPLKCAAVEGACDLTCEVLADPSFCWNVARAEANACGASESKGVMSGDGLSCTSLDTVVRFDAPVLVTEVTDRETWGIEVSRGGNTCLELDDGPLSLALETSSGRVNVSLTLQPEFYRIECPDGSAWEAYDQMALLACKDADGFTSLPGISTVTFGDEFQFGLLPGPDSLLWCTF